MEAAVVDFEFAGPGLVAVRGPSMSNSHQGWKVERVVGGFC